MIEITFRDIISALHRFGKYFTIEKDKQIISNFTRYFHNLHTYVKVNYRKIGKATDISIGNLTRLEQGNEPIVRRLLNLQISSAFPLLKCFRTIHNSITRRYKRKYLLRTRSRTLDRLFLKARYGNRTSSRQIFLIRHKWKSSCINGLQK